jgi:L-fucose isomerase-like protein
MVNKDLLPGAFDDSEKTKALRTFGAFKTIAERYGLSGFTVRCFDLLQPLATTGCAGLALLNDEGITATCEGDIAALISMHIVRLLTNQPSFQANPSRISPADNTAVLAHCTIPLAMTKDLRLDTHFESGTGIAIKGFLREENVTIFRLPADLKNFFVSDGKILKNLDEPDLCRTQILVKFEEDVSEILRKPCGNHHIVFYGHHADDIRRVMKNILN